MTPLKEWCRKRGLGLTTAYGLANRKLLKLKKVGRLTFVTDEADAEFIAGLPDYEPRAEKRV